MFIFHGPEIQNESRKRPQLAAAGLPSRGPCQRQLLRGKQQPYPKGREGGVRWDPAPPWPPPVSPQIINSHLLKPQGETPPLRPQGSAGSQESLFRWRRIQGLHFIGENGYQNTVGRLGLGRASSRRHSLALYSSDPGAESSELGSTG